jgi:lipid-A-disaccharide synthase
MEPPVTLFFVAGEASGDARGAELIRSLRMLVPGLVVHGRGGSAMRALAGPEFEDWSERAGVIGIIDVLKNYGYFKRQFDRTVDEIRELKPEAVVLIDYPGFNLRLAAKLKAFPHPPRIFYYVSPQVWAWHRSRIPKMARTVDLMMCIFPFEKELYEMSGLKTVFVGHPMLDSLAARRIDAPRDPRLVGLFPGSRKREVKKIFPVMLGAAMRMQQASPELTFEAAPASEPMAERMYGMLRKYPELRCKITQGDSHGLMQRAGAGMVASGTATMEAAYFRLPFAIIYRTAWLTFFLGRKLVHVPFLGMANILAGREIVREFLQEEARPDLISDYMMHLLRDDAERGRLVAQLGEVVAMLGAPGAGERAAAAIVAELGAGARA